MNKIWLSPIANQTSRPQSAVAHLQRMAQAAVPLVHQTLPSAAEENTPKEDREAGSPVFSEGGKADSPNLLGVINIKFC